MVSEESKNKVKKVVISYEENKGINVTIELNGLSEQNFYHLEKAISNHLELQEERVKDKDQTQIQKFSDYLIGYMICLRDKLRNEFPQKTDW